jgi:stage II sporulation protein D
VRTGTIEPWPAGRSGRIVWTVLSKLAPRAARRASERGRTARARLALSLVAAAFILTLTDGIAVGATTYAALCDSVNLRTGASTTYPIKKAVAASTKVTVVATVTGGSYRTTCNGVSRSGSSWFRISAISGKSVSSLYGITYVYGASTLFKVVVNPTPAPTVAASSAPSPGASPAASTAPSPAASPSPDPSGSPSPNPSPTPTPSVPPGATLLGSSVTIYGRGYGHGVGLSQYGAYGRAVAGQTYQAILGHYYQGTTLSTTTATSVRVLVLSSWTASGSAPLKLYGLGGTWTFDGIAKTFPAGALARLIPTASGATVTWKLVVTATDGTTLYSAATSGSLRMRPASTATTLRLYSKPSYYDTYRGVLRVMASSTTPTITVVNEVGLDDYLKGVVGVEMPYAWPTNALRAQAIASRSYAVKRLHPSTGTYDIFDDTRSQVYRGVKGEHSTSTNAIAATAAVVLRSGSAVANAMFHSAGGGATESNQNVFNAANGAITTSAVPYLQGSMDRAPDGTAYDKASPYATWHTATYTLAQVQAFFAADSRTNVGTLIAIDLTNRGVGDRLVSVTLYGLDGTTKTVSGGVFESVFNAERPSADSPMRDTLYDLAPIP